MCLSVISCASMEQKNLDDFEPIEWSKYEPSPPWDSAKTIGELKTLIRSGYDPNVKRSKNDSYPLRSIRGHRGMEILLQGGADPATRPLTWLYTPEMPKLLIQYGLKPDQPDKWGNYPVFSLNTVILKWALEHGADPNMRNASGFTPMMEAASSWNSEDNLYKVMKLLLDHGADIHAKNENSGRTVMSYVMPGYDRVTGLLLKHGADPTEVQRMGRRGHAIP